MRTILTFRTLFIVELLSELIKCLDVLPGHIVLTETLSVGTFYSNKVTGSTVQIISGTVKL